MKIEKKLDKWMWFIIMILPIISYLALLLGASGNIDYNAYTFLVITDTFALNESNIITETLMNIGNILGTYTLDVGQPLNMLCFWIVIVNLVHILIDILLFIVRLGKKLCEEIL